MILIVSPALDENRAGNGVTAHRWAAILTGLGHQVECAQSYDDREFDLLIALHAHKSADSIRRFHATQPHAPVILALTGTDLYPDLESTGVDPAVLDQADRIVVLQKAGLDQLSTTLRTRGRVIVQSVPPITTTSNSDTDTFDVAFLAHLREVKDPLRPAAATRLLPAGSRIRVVHAGHAMDASLGERARAEADHNPRYDWVGPLPRDEALTLLAVCDLLVLCSWHEGGANVISEALAAQVPIICSRIPGSIGLLGPDYPGYFPPGDTAALATLLHSAESDRGFYDRLRDHCAAARRLVHPDNERAAWTSLLNELSLLPSVP